MTPADAATELARLQARNRALAAAKLRLEADAARLRSAHTRLQAETRRGQQEVDIETNCRDR